MSRVSPPPFFLLGVQRRPWRRPKAKDRVSYSRRQPSFSATYILGSKTTFSWAGWTTRVPEFFLERESIILHKHGYMPTEATKKSTDPERLLSPHHIHRSSSSPTQKNRTFYDYPGTFFSLHGKLLGFGLYTLPCAWLVWMLALLDDMGSII